MLLSPKNKCNSLVSHRLFFFIVKLICFVVFFQQDQSLEAVKILSSVEKILIITGINFNYYILCWAKCCRISDIFDCPFGFNSNIEALIPGIVDKSQLIVARVPVLRFTCADSRFAGIQVDMNASNTISIRNTHLICHYLSRKFHHLPISYRVINSFIMDPSGLESEASGVCYKGMG